MHNWQTAPVLCVSNVPEAIDFFCDKLGFDRPEQLYGSDVVYYAIVKRAGVQVHLLLRDSPQREKVTSAYFKVQDLAALETEFRARSVAFNRDTQDQPFGYRDFIIETPDGHRLTFGAGL